MITDNPEKICLVPMDVEALCVSTRDAAERSSNPDRFAGARTDFSNMPYRKDGREVYTISRANLGENIRTGLFPAQEPLGRGVHIHWSIPDALTRASGAGGSLDFPRVPNRWLVTRIAPAADGTPETRSWIVESDRLMTSEEYAAYHAATGRISITVPVAAGVNEEPYRYLGRVYDLDDWSESAGARYAPLTAAGYGDPMFAAYYPECRSVFGFFDAMPADARAGRFSYHVFGWYSDPSHDPLRRLDGPDAQKIATTFDWVLPADVMPDTVVLHGTLAGIWFDPNADTLLAQPPADAALEVALGNTASEAVAALFAARIAPADQERRERTEFLLNALATGQLGQLGEDAGSLAALEIDLHERAFSPFAGGLLWSVQKMDGRADETLQDAARDQADALPDDLVPLLHALNLRQTEYDAMTRQLTGRRAQLYADWYTAQKIAYPVSGDIDADLVNHAMAALQRSLADIQNLSAEMGESLFDARTHTFATPAAAVPDSCAVRLARQWRQTADRLSAGMGPAFVLRAIPASRFYRPNDPVVLIAGSGLVAPARYGGDGRYSADGRLSCRPGQAIIAALLGPGEGNTVVRVELLASPPDNEPITSRVAAVATALVREAILLDESFATYLGTQSNLPVNTIRAAQLAAKNGDATYIADAAPAGSARAPVPFAHKSHERVYLPLFVRWEADYGPFEDLDHAYPADYLTRNCDAVEAFTDLQYRNPPPAAYERLSGDMLLTGGAAQKLRMEIDALLGEAGAQLSVTVPEDLRVLPLLSQAMSGFHDALLMRARGLQLAISDPGAPDPLGRELARRVADAVRSENVFMPVPESGYHPVRGGTLRLARLRVVDVFGEVREQNAPAALYSFALRDPAGGSQAYVRPRFSQPARLRFRWLAADAESTTVESNDHPATGPVCGWLVPDHLNGGLFVYRPDGGALGALQTSGGGAVVEWQGVPNSTGAESHPAAIAWPNTHLRDFVLAVLNGNRAGFLSELLRASDRALLTIQPQRASGAVFTGRPLALARASLALELYGDPVANVSRHAFEMSVRHPDLARDTRDFEQVRVPVRLGDAGYSEDGLIGYFVEGPTAPDYSVCFAASGTTGEVRPPQAAEHVQLSVAGGVRYVTMIFDPHAAVHAVTGVLPAERIEVPPAQYQPALAALEEFFPIHPLLGGPAGIYAPAAAPPGFEWSWIVPSTAGVAPVDADGRNFFVSAPKLLREVRPPEFARRVVEEGWLRLRRRGAS